MWQSPITNFEDEVYTNYFRERKTDFEVTLYNLSKDNNQIIPVFEVSKDKRCNKRREIQDTKDEVYKYCIQNHIDLYFVENRNFINAHLHLNPSAIAVLYCKKSGENIEKRRRMLCNFEVYKAYHKIVIHSFYKNILDSIKKYLESEISVLKKRLFTYFKYEEAFFSPTTEDYKLRYLFYVTPLYIYVRCGQAEKFFIYANYLPDYAKAEFMLNEIELYAMTILLLDDLQSFFVSLFSKKESVANMGNIQQTSRTKALPITFDVIYFNKWDAC